MEVYEQDAVLDGQPAQAVDPYQMGPEMAQQYYEQPEPQYQQQESDMFSRPNDLRVIQEYNREENMPSKAKKNFWALASKSIKLGFWKEEDFQNLWLRQNSIKLNYVMSQPKHKYTFHDRLDMQQMELMVYADFKRGIGMERYKINERTLQATSVTQSIQGGGTSGGKKGGAMSAIKNFFG